MSLRDLRPPHHAAPELTLVLLHHAGGSAGSFIPFVPLLPTGWRLLAVDLPGRLFEPPGRSCRDTTEAVDYLLSVLPPQTGEPYAVFGHSLGALLGFELTRALERRGGGPRWLGVSGCPAPQVVGVASATIAGAAWSFRRLPGFAGVPGGLGPERGSARQSGGGGERFGGRSVRRPGDPVAERIGERTLRALGDDLALVDGYEYVAGPPLRAALSVFRGDDDPLTPVAFTRPWADHAAGGAAFHTWPGDHFYLFEHAVEVCERVVHTCRSLLRR